MNDTLIAILFTTIYITSTIFAYLLGHAAGTRKAINVYKRRRMSA